MRPHHASLVVFPLIVSISSPVLADHQHSPATKQNTIEEVVVEYTPVSNIAIIELPQRPVTDTAELLKTAPGANINSNGPLTGIAQIRGLYAQRINTKINGSKITSGGPNFMDAPLSYAPAATLEELTIYRDIPPVSAGQETLGGAIVATPWRPAFNLANGIALSGRIAAAYQSNNDATEALLTTAAAGRNHKVMLSLLDNRGNDSEFDGGTIRPTEFERQRGEFAYGYQRGRHMVSISQLRNETGDAGTPSLPMDIEFIDTDSSHLGYEYEAGNWGTKFTANHAEVEHRMTNFHLRQPPTLAGEYKANFATADSNDGHLQLWFKTTDFTWRTGIDYHHAVHDALISNPNNPNFYVLNFNDAEKEIYGTYIELESPADHKTRVQAGIRVNYVSWDSDKVAAAGLPTTPTDKQMMANMRAMNFNTSDRSDNEVNVDVVIQFSHQLTDSLDLVVGMGRKNRSASYQERFLWMPMEATAGLADGRTYVGNLDLKAETSHDITLGLDFQSQSLHLSPRVFVKEIHDYIQGTEPDNPMATYLEFNNIEARLYGADMQAKWNISDHWQLDSVVSYVRGTREDIDDNLYRIAPLNGLLSATYSKNTWSTSLELEAAAAQNKVSELNHEKPSAGYSLWNIHAQKQFAEGLTLGAGVKNLFDRNYADHLSGINRAENPDIALFDRVPGIGRNIYTKLSYTF